MLQPTKEEKLRDQFQVLRNNLTLLTDARDAVERAVDAAVKILNEPKGGKLWNYDMITQEAEDRIRTFMDLSTKAKNDSVRETFRNFAQGIFLGWESLTAGSNEATDRERLEALTKIKKDTP